MLNYIISFNVVFLFLIFYNIFNLINKKIKLKKIIKINMILNYFFV